MERIAVTRGQCAYWCGGKEARGARGISACGPGVVGLVVDSPVHGKLVASRENEQRSLRTAHRCALQ